MQGAGSEDTLSSHKLMSDASAEAVAVKQPRSVFLASRHHSAALLAPGGSAGESPYTSPCFGLPAPPSPMSDASERYALRVDQAGPGHASPAGASHPAAVPVLAVAGATDASGARSVRTGLDSGRHDAAGLAQMAEAALSCGGSGVRPAMPANASEGALLQPPSTPRGIRVAWNVSVFRDGPADSLAMPKLAVPRACAAAAAAEEPGGPGSAQDSAASSPMQGGDDGWEILDGDDGHAVTSFGSVSPVEYVLHRVRKSLGSRGGASTS